VTAELLGFIMFAVTIGVLIAGFPVALTLAGSSLLFAFVGDQMGLFPLPLLNLFPSRILGTMKNEALVAVPLFIFMGVMLEKSNLAGELLEAIGKLFGKRKGGLGVAVVLVGAMLAASTGIVGATVVTMGLISLPIMLRSGYSPQLSSGLICASGTLGQIIPPSIVLILLGTILQGANEQAALIRGDLAPDPVTAIDLFAGALLPGLMLVGLYLLYIGYKATVSPEECPSLQGQGSTEKAKLGEILRVMLPPLILIFLVLGSILAGIATPTESAGVGAVGATVLSWLAGGLRWSVIVSVARETTKISSMVFLILIGASLFSLVFRGFGGDEIVEEFLLNMPGGAFSALVLVMLVMFFLGFFLDFIEIIFVIVPIVGPILIGLGYDPLWLGVMIAVNLQTSFLTPPFGFALFYLRGVAPKEVRTLAIYRGVIPFIGIQVLALVLLWIFPGIVTWLPNLIF
jgi:tripartite ATP-independent transporter DctM subunit